MCTYGELIIAVLIHQKHETTIKKKNKNKIIKKNELSVNAFIRKFVEAR